MYDKIMIFTEIGSKLNRNEIGKDYWQSNFGKN